MSGAGSSGVTMEEKGKGRKQTNLAGSRGSLERFWLEPKCSNVPVRVRQSRNILAFDFLNDHTDYCGEHIRGWE